VQHLTGKLFPQGYDTVSMVAHLVRRHFLPLPDVCPNASQICKLVLFGSVTPDINSVSHTMQSTFCLTENIFSSEVKQDRTQLPNATHMHLDDLDQMEKQ
jgi:hypothetical protein